MRCFLDALSQPPALCGSCPEVELVLCSPDEFFFHDLVQLLFKTKLVVRMMFCSWRTWCVRNIPFHLLWASMYHFPPMRPSLFAIFIPILIPPLIFPNLKSNPILSYTLSAFSTSFVVLWSLLWGWSYRKPWLPIAVHGLESFWTSVLQRPLGRSHSWPGQGPSIYISYVDCPLWHITRRLLLATQVAAHLKNSVLALLGVVFSWFDYEEWVHVQGEISI